MRKINISDKQMLFTTTLEYLIQEIKTGIYSNSQKLPPEVELAEDIGVSRTLIRDCLMTLEREGLISRKLGMGTFINKHVLDVTTRIDLEVEFLEMIQQAGYRASIPYVKSEEIKADTNIAKKLDINIGDSVIRVERIVSADDRPAIYCIDHFPKVLIIHPSPDYDSLKEPIFSFFRKYCNTDVHMDLTEVEAICVNEELEKKLKVKKGTPIIYMDEVGYSFKGETILYSQEYYANNILKHTILRKKI